MAELRNKQFIIDGKPRLVLAGEVHYFRLKGGDWGDRLKKAKNANCNAIASYIPWLYHEEVEGDTDLTGRKTPEHDLGAFIDLCKAHELLFIARPGPFIMGEIKNEGIPDWIYTKHPDAVPVTWGGKKVTSRTLNYLDPGFLQEVGRWYSAVMPILASRLDTKGGNVIAVQLDNEIGMLQCWTEEADLSDSTLCEFAEWVQKHRDPKEIENAYPFDMGDPVKRAQVLRDGSFSTARHFHKDYTEFTRDRFARYAALLRGSAEQQGVRDVPFIINIHGSGGGRATTFPIGISQTYEAYTQAPDFWGSSDHYLGEISRQNVQDLYFLNAFMEAVNLPNQPLSSVEFEAGTGDYGETGGARQSNAATDFKARLSVVQGNRMLNHYLLAGGFNPMLERPKEDGNGRIGTTGEHHGFAAPIGPTGKLDPTYYGLADTNGALLAVEEHLATMREEHDGVAIGFIPDYYSTDVKRPGPMRELAAKLETARGFLESLTRAMLDLSLSFTAHNLQGDGPIEASCLVLASSSVLARDIQERLVTFLQNGGSLFLYGRIPEEDMEGRACRVLADVLGVTSHPILEGSPTFFPSLTGEDLARDEPEVRIWQMQPFAAAQHEPFLKVSQQSTFGGTFLPLGKGKACLVTAELKSHRHLWKRIFKKLGVEPKFVHDYEFGGVVLNRIRDDQGQRFVSLMNLDFEDKRLALLEDGRLVFPHQVFLPARKAKLLPLGVQVGPFEIEWSTTEVIASDQKSVTFRRTLSREQLILRGHAKADGISAVVVQQSDSSTVILVMPGEGGARISIQDPQ